MTSASVGSSGQAAADEALGAGEALMPDEAPGPGEDVGAIDDGDPFATC